jgi:NADP oxidoreductase coenzyme F420-dependent
VALVLGICTRWAALGAAGVMAMAVCALQTVKGFGWTWSTGGYEYPVFWGLAAVAVAVALTEFKRIAKPSAPRLIAALATPGALRWATQPSFAAISAPEGELTANADRFAHAGQQFLAALEGTSPSHVNDSLRVVRCNSLTPRRSSSSATRRETTDLEISSASSPRTKPPASTTATNACITRNRSMPDCPDSRASQSPRRLFIRTTSTSRVQRMAAMSLRTQRSHQMKVTVIGAGNMGSAFVNQLVKAGHQVSVTARDAAKASKLAAANAGASRKASVFLASDSATAKQQARTLAESMGFDVVDASGLKNVRYLEPLAGLNIYLGYGAGLGTAIAPTWLRKA